MNRALTLTLACLLLAGLANASQVTYISASKVRSSDFSSDGNVTFNGTAPTSMTVNQSGYCYGHWASPLRGCITNASLTAWRNWTLPDEDGTLLLGPTPTFTDYSNANHDHEDTDDGGALDAAALGSGTVARARLPSELPYEDEANTFSLVQTFSDGLSIAVGDCVVFNADAYLCRNGANSANTTGAWTSNTAWTTLHHQVNGTLIAKTNSYMEGPFRANGTVKLDDFTTDGRIPFFNGSDGTVTVAPGLCWDVNNNRLGIAQWGTCSTSQTLDIRNVGNGAGFFIATAQQGAASGPGFVFRGWTGASNTDMTMRWEGDSTLDFEPGGTGALSLGPGAVGLYTKTPVSQAADIVQVTDSTGGTISSTCAAIAAGALYAQADAVALKNCVASLIAKINALDTALDNIGVTA